MSTKKHFTTITKVYRLIREFRKLNPELTCQVAEAFILVCLEEGITVSSLAEKMGTTTATASRHVGYLGEWDRRGRRGLKLVEAREVIGNRRYKEVRLTQKGRMLRDTLVELAES